MFGLSYLYKAIGAIVTAIIGGLLDLFSGVNLNGVVQGMQTITPYLKAALYMLPVGTLKAIFAIIVALWTFRLIVKTIKLIWDLIPVL